MLCGAREDRASVPKRTHKPKGGCLGLFLKDLQGLVPQRLFTSSHDESLSGVEQAFRSQERDLVRMLISKRIEKQAFKKKNS